MNSLINIFNFSALNAMNSELLNSLGLLLKIIFGIAFLIAIISAHKIRKLSDEGAFLMAIISIILGFFVFFLIQILK